MGENFEFDQAKKDERKNTKPESKIITSMGNNGRSGPRSHPLSQRTNKKIKYGR